MEEDYDYDVLLFTRPDGMPMVFCLLPDKDWQHYRPDLARDVEKRGGVLLDYLPQDHSNHSDTAIRLLGKNEVPDKRKEMFDFRYLTDCIRENRILENMFDYRVSKSSIYQQYDRYEPLDILYGYKKWSELPPRDEGERISDIEDDFEVSNITVNRSKATSIKTYL